MRVGNWISLDRDRKIGVLRERLWELLRGALHVLKRPNPLMLFSVFFGFSGIREELDKTNLMFQVLDKYELNENDEEDADLQNDGWKNSARDEFIYGYM
jgi:hypothetical protein